MPVIGALVSGHMDKRKLMNGSRWSFLLTLERELPED
jgi:hypothetical protein